MNDEELDRGLAALPRAISPASDLWPEIAARVNRRRPHTARPVVVPAIAAALTVAVALGLVFTRPSADGGIVIDPALRSAFADVVGTRDDLDDETVTRLRGQQAAALETIERLTAALEERPDDTDLQRQLLHAYRGQVLHLDTLGRAPRGIF